MYNDKTATSDSEKANLFAEFFASVFIKRPADTELDDFIDRRNDDGFEEVQITPEIVEQILSTMDLSKGQGPDLIPINRTTRMCQKYCKPTQLSLRKIVKRWNLSGHVQAKSNNTNL